MILSILVPAQAAALAREVAAALEKTGCNTYFTDCNAVSPRTAGAIQTVITDAGGRFIDGSIIGEPPGRGSPPRFYVSGEHAGVMAELAGEEIDVRFIGDQVGRASAIKMCYAGLTKGTFALYFAVLTAAEAMGLSDELRSEFIFSQAEAHRRMESPSSPAGEGFPLGCGNARDRRLIRGRGRHAFFAPRRRRYLRDSQQDALRSGNTRERE